MKFFKKALAGVAVVVAVGAFAPAPTQATSETDDVCYETVMVEWIQKMTRTVNQDLEWTQWRFWPGSEAFPDDGRFRGPAAHNNLPYGTPGYREYKYNVNATLPTQVEVDCPGVTPEPTVPETTVPEPTVPLPELPEPTVPEVTTPVPNECWVNSDGDTPLDGPFVLYDSTSDPGAVGTHSISGLACGPEVADPCYEDEPCWDCETMGNNQCGTVVTDIADPAPVPEATAAPTLPATGNETTYIALAALAALTAGLIFVKVARR